MKHHERPSFSLRFGASMRRAIAGLCFSAVVFVTQVYAAPLTIVALGTSLTKDGGWVEALETALSPCAGREVRAINIGGSGETSTWGRTMIPTIQAASPDILLIEFAINDAHVLKGISRSAARDNIRAIVAATRQRRPEVRVILLLVGH